MGYDQNKVTKKSVYFPDDIAEFIERLSLKENRSFTKQVVTIVNNALDDQYPGWKDGKSK